MKSIAFAVFVFVALCFYSYCSYTQAMMHEHEWYPVPDNSYLISLKTSNRLKLTFEEPLQ